MFQLFRLLNCISIGLSFWHLAFWDSLETVVKCLFKSKTVSQHIYLYLKGRILFWISFWKDLVNKSPIFWRWTNLPKRTVFYWERNEADNLFPMTSLLPLFSLSFLKNETEWRFKEDFDNKDAQTCRDVTTRSQAQQTILPIHWHIAFCIKGFINITLLVHSIGIYAQLLCHTHSTLYTKKKHIAIGLKAVIIGEINPCQLKVKLNKQFNGFLGLNFETKFIPTQTCMQHRNHY